MAEPGRKVKHGSRSQSETDVPNFYSVATHHTVALSTADTNKWLLLIEGRLEGQTPENNTSSDYQLVGPIRQRQRRLTKVQVVEIAAKYQAGATVYKLAAEFGCHRTTEAERLKKAGIVMRGQSPKSGAIKSYGASVRERRFI